MTKQRARASLSDLAGRRTPDVDPNALLPWRPQRRARKATTHARAACMTFKRRATEVRPRSRKNKKKCAVNRDRTSDLEKPRMACITEYFSLTLSQLSYPGHECLVFP